MELTQEQIIKIIKQRMKSLKEDYESCVKELNKELTEGDIRYLETGIETMEELKEERAAYGELEYLLELIFSEDERNADGIDL
ncbi:MAG: hypothetical protein J6U54_12100 [Clostridiales bacterium]|nr:hypothetical protein [Clostridiales bacterium]